MYISKICMSSLEGDFFINLDKETLSAQIESLHGINSNTIKLMILSWCSLIQDSPIDPIKPKRIINRFLNNLIFNTFSIIESYSRLNHMITKSISHDGQGIVIDSFVSEMKDTPIFREYLSFTRTRDPYLLQYISSFLLFGKKVPYIDASLDANALRDWLKVEDRIGALTFSPSVLRNLRIICKLIFSDWSFDGFYPVYGSGAVSERGVRGINGKSRHFRVDNKILRTYIHNGLLSHDFDPRTIFPKDLSSYESTSSDVARLKFVPKDWNKTRTICMEPNLYQWAQQGVRLVYEHYISRSLLNNHIFIENQEENQYAAEFGSYTGLVDTIDLSSASDSVRYDLVKGIFPPSVLRHLVATRSRRVELPDGRIISPLKFAPMGSALCFPVQSTLFSLIVIYASICQNYCLDMYSDIPDLEKNFLGMYHSTFRKGYSKDRRNRYYTFRCYGDDITCDKRVTSNVMDLLNHLGFEVNAQKSYTGENRYRESCGKYYFNGIDVTPIRFKTRTIPDKISIDSMASYIGLANRAFEYGYYALRRTLIQFVQYYPIQGVNIKRGKMNPISFSDDPNSTFSILTSYPRNHHLKKRFNPYLFRSEIRSITAGPRTVKEISPKYDNYRYGSWWRSRYSVVGTLNKSVHRAADSLGVGVRWAWRPA